ncbi:hypothetical protein K491DRAFT_610457 [Lophiostoma macrostomum CBS 122681]|uniref:HAD-like protein n=1 Tax=Lophiostoma macrostomum CBS 122681 TaxID=1314788 RepID=A0A6A6SQ09_9PLEO|nr:hypothetical protein K491DRAFT_610457 [Lophiostoma macrostomum CBS 122681]
MPRPAIRSHRAIHWILDWDGTLTNHDTLGALVNIAKDAKHVVGIQAKWQDLGRAYRQDHDAATTARDLPATLLDERQLLRRLGEVEQKSVDRVVASGIFEGLRSGELQHGAVRAIASQDVQLRRGCLDFLSSIYSRIDAQDTDLDAVDVLSVNWSQQFIAMCLNASNSALTPNPQFDLRDTVNNHAKSGRPRLVSSDDKLYYLQRLRRTNPYTMKPIPIVYIGDGWMDLECLLAADLGICIRDTPMTSSQQQLEGSLSRLNIHCPHVNDWDECDEWAIAWAQDFSEVNTWMGTMDTHTSPTGLQ